MRKTIKTIVMLIVLVISVVYPVSAYADACPRGGPHYYETKEYGTRYERYLGTHKHLVGFTPNGKIYEDCKMTGEYISTKLVCSKCQEVYGYGEKQVKVCHEK